MATSVHSPNPSGLVQPSELHRMSVEEYHRLIERGGFDEDARIELIDGYLVDMSPKSPPHENAIRWLMYWLIDHLDRSRHDVRVASPLTLGASEPEPDVAVVEHAAPRLEHPTRALLVIEVAVTSIDRDLRTKPAVYAPTVEEYWVVDLEAQRVVVHRDPRGDSYRKVTSISAGAPLGAPSLVLAELPTGDLFAAAHSRSA